MLHRKASAIKNWINIMGFELVKSDILKNSLFNYYSLGNFGVYEEVVNSVKSDKINKSKTQKFISWNPWGEFFEVNSVKDLDDAYQDSLIINPELPV